MRSAPASAAVMALSMPSTQSSMRGMEGSKKESVFFFEKKNQKTFPTLRGG
jgi:hypothetical protein